MRQQWLGADFAQNKLGENTKPAVHEECPQSCGTEDHAPGSAGCVEMSLPSGGLRPWRLQLQSSSSKFSEPHHPVRKQITQGPETDC